MRRGKAFVVGGHVVFPMQKSYEVCIVGELQLCVLSTQTYYWIKRPASKIRTVAFSRTKICKATLINIHKKTVFLYQYYLDLTILISRYFAFVPTTTIERLLNFYSLSNEHHETTFTDEKVSSKHCCWLRRTPKRDLINDSRTTSSRTGSLLR